MTKLEEFYFQDTPKEHLDFLNKLDYFISQNAQTTDVKSIKNSAKCLGGG